MYQLFLDKWLFYSTCKLLEIKLQYTVGYSTCIVL